MNRTKIFGTVLAVLAVFMITSIASAQQYAGILHDQWFNVNLSLKGYTIADDGETVLGKGAGSKKAYLHFSYNGPDTSYTITTCMQDDLNDNIWYTRQSAAISIDDIYGAVYPQVWDLGGTSLFGTRLRFFDGVSTFDVYPTFYTKVTADKANAATLKNATISNVICSLYAELEGGEYGTGSCILNGPLVPAAKVTTKVPLLCREPVLTD